MKRIIFVAWAAVLVGVWAGPASAFKYTIRADTTQVAAGTKFLSSYNALDTVIVTGERSVMGRSGVNTHWASRSKTNAAETSLDFGKRSAVFEDSSFGLYFGYNIYRGLASPTIAGMRSISTGTAAYGAIQGSAIAWGIGNAVDTVYTEVASAYLSTGGFHAGRPGGTSITRIDSTGHQTMVGAGRPWKDAIGDAIGLRSTGPGVAANPDSGSSDFLTTANSADYIYSNYQFNHDRDTTSVVSPHVHFIQTENQEPHFVIMYRWLGLGRTSGAWTSVPCSTSVLPYVANGHQLMESADIAPSGQAISDILQIKLYREGVGDSTLWKTVDKYTTTVKVIGMDVHYQINSLGSRSEYSK